MHHRRRFVVLLLALAMLLPAIAPGAAARQPGDRLYINHAARFSAMVPAEWSFDLVRPGGFAGPGGFIIGYPVMAASLDEACTAHMPDLSDPRRSIEVIEWRGQPSCRYHSTVPGEDPVALVVPHPYSFQRYGDTYDWVVIVGDAQHFDGIVETISFEPQDVTPEDHVGSVVELVETYGYFAEGVDWDQVNQQIVNSTEGMSAEEMQRDAVGTVIQALQANGDNHSHVRFPEEVARLGTQSGSGATLLGNRVVLVSPDSPADRAGIQPGDEIIAFDGRPLPAANRITKLILPAGKASVLTVRRAEGTTIDVILEPGPYGDYAPPNGRLVDGQYGYVLVPELLAPGVDATFAAEGHAVVRDVEQQGACGWIVDLRLDTGGSYAPMVTAIGPVLGNGPFANWQDTQGTLAELSYRDGEIWEYGHLAYDLLGDDAYVAATSDAPVAILTGSLTGSAGEVTAMAFVDRPNARFFGERTAGLTTGVRTFYLFDGTAMALASSAVTDRTGQTHLDGIEPDENVPVDWTRFGTDEDPAIVAATEWLAEQPACARATPVASPAA